MPTQKPYRGHQWHEYVLINVLVYLAQMVVILDFTNNAMAKMIYGHTTRYSINTNHVWWTSQS